jgi:hypothetical protein
VLTLLAAGAGVYFTVKTSSAASDVESLQAETEREGDPGAVMTSSQCSPSAPSRPPACDDLSERIDDHDRNQALALGSFIGAGVFGAATLMTVLVWPSASSKDAARLELAPLPVQRGHGLRARLVF